MNLRFKLYKHQVSRNCLLCFLHIVRGVCALDKSLTLPHLQLHSDMNVVKVLLEVEDCQWQDAGEGGQMPKKAIQVLTDSNNNSLETSLAKESQNKF